ncbi:MAG TPA: NAD(P)/FAD-dependent oxidoreductase [Syntrophobacteraceae bacterium]|nr:NAD(P)/FAD-dependent oxidoreductase [Syntrophobacteraceae bacterium]
MDRVDVVIVGAGPGGVSAAIRSRELGLKAVVLEKGLRLFQGIIETYPRGKKVYPTIPKDEEQPFAIPDLEPANEPVEEYVSRIEACVAKHGITICYGEEFQGFSREKDSLTVTTVKNRYKTSAVILAFGSNIPIDLGIYGEAKVVARNLGNPEEHIGVPTLVLGGGNAAADVVSTLSKTKRAAGDSTPVYWGHRREHFKIDKDVARDLGEEILLGGNIKILQGAVPRIGEVDEDGVERLIIQTQRFALPHGVEITHGMSFPMKHVIACIGTQGPSSIFDRLGLQQITCTAGVCKIGKEGAKLLMLSHGLRTSVNGVYAIGGAISPAYLHVEEQGTLRERKHSNLIFKAVQDGVRAVEDIAMQRGGTAPPRPG